MATANRTIDIKPISVNVLTAQEQAAERLKYLQSQNLYATDSPIPSYDGAEEQSDMYAGRSFFPTASAADLSAEIEPQSEKSWLNSPIKESSSNASRDESKSTVARDPSFLDAPLKKDDEKKTIAWSDIPGKMIGNLYPSGTQAASDIAYPFMHPIETAKGLGTLGLGLIQKFIPGEQEAEKSANAVGEFFAQRYGGIEQLKNTLANDPVGFLLDASTVMTGGGALAARAPGVTGKVGKVVRNVGENIDPLTYALKAPGAVLKGVQKPEVRRLMEQGVTPTAGQILGGGFKTTEDALGSIPVLGSAIGGARQRANQQLNTAAYNRALNPIGETAKGVPTGAEGIAYVSDKLSAAYDKLLDKVTLKPDAQLLDDVVASMSEATSLIGKEAASVLENIIDVKLINRLSDDVPLSGEQLKIIESDLGKLATTYGKGNASDQIISEAITNAQAALRDALGRSNPAQAAELKAINTGYANYARLRYAGSQAGAELKTGFTPAQLRAGVKASDQSVGKGKFARGRALMQDLSTDAREVMGGNLPTSGTAERGILAGLMTAGSFIDPVTGGVVASAMLPYLPRAQRGMANLLTSRPEIVRRTGKALQQYGSPIGATSFQAGRVERERAARLANALRTYNQ